MEKLKEDRIVTLEEVKKSDVGCSQCLWAGIECKNYEKFSPKWSDVFNQPSCHNYAYCD